MVRVGNHSLELVNAATLTALPEYSHKGKTWVEGQPGAEYLLKITSHQSGTRTIAHPIEVDGSSIGYIFQHGPDINLTTTMGPVSSPGTISRGGKVGCKSFRFSRLNHGDFDASTGHGMIRVTWSTASDTGIPSSGFHFGWNGVEKSVPDSKKESVGALQSVKGSSDSSMPTAKTYWHVEEQLYSATIYYC